MTAGSCSFHSGLTVHGAGANMTNGLRRAMTCAFMPDGAVFNGQQNVLSDAQVAACVSEIASTIPPKIRSRTSPAAESDGTRSTGQGRGDHRRAHRESASRVP